MFACMPTLLFFIARSMKERDAKNGSQLLLLEQLLLLGIFFPTIFPLIPVPRPLKTASYAGYPAI
jgi:hypothetical protein